MRLRTQTPPYLPNSSSPTRSCRTRLVRPDLTRSRRPRRARPRMLRPRYAPGAPGGSGEGTPGRRSGGCCSTTRGPGSRGSRANRCPVTCASRGRQLKSPCGLSPTNGRSAWFGSLAGNVTMPSVSAIAAAGEEPKSQSTDGRQSSSVGTRPLHCSMNTLWYGSNPLAVTVKGAASTRFHLHDDDIIRRLGDARREHRRRGPHHHGHHTDGNSYCPDQRAHNAPLRSELVDVRRFVVAS